MLSLKLNEKAMKFHNSEAEVILDKIINNKIGKDKLSNDTKKIIKRYKNILIKGKPNLLLRVHEKYCNLDNVQKEIIKDFFQNTVYPNHFQKKHGKEFLNKLGIDTCTYCNRNYTLYFGINHSRAELDHWFPKNEFPLLALSFYNLIPSCHSCNHIKGDSKKLLKRILNKDVLTNVEISQWLANSLEHLNHPYLEKNEFKFSYYYKSLSDFNMKVIVDKGSKSETTIKYNSISEIYGSHSNKELKDLLELRYKYSKNYMDILLNKTFKGLAFSKEEAYRMIFGIEINEDDYHKRPFSKFKHDIIEELKTTFN